MCSGTVSGSGVRRDRRRPEPAGRTLGTSGVRAATPETGGNEPTGGRVSKQVGSALGGLRDSADANTADLLEKATRTRFFMSRTRNARPRLLFG